MSTVAISAADINKLRQATGAGMMDCRKALTEANGILKLPSTGCVNRVRKLLQSAVIVKQRSVVIAQTTPDNKTGIALCISCETDFVSKNADFVAFAQSISDAAIANNVKSAEELNEVSVNGAKVSELINDKLASIGEKIGISKFERIDADFVASYIHGAYRMGVLVGLNQAAPEVGKDVAMQIAAMNPLAIDPASIPAETVERKEHRNRPNKERSKMAGKPDE
jgi:elongation factor Ts